MAAKQARTDDPKELVKVDAPSYLAEHVEKDRSMEGMGQFRILPRLVIVQGQSGSELKDMFGEGSVLLQPGKVGVTRRDEKFKFVPLIFFPEYMLWSDFRDKNSPTIRERSYDQASEIAKKSKAKETRRVEYPGAPAGEKPFTMRYVEHLQFAGLLLKDGHELHETPCVLGFSRGEFITGQNFIGAIMRRKVTVPGSGLRPAPLWSQVWELGVGRRNKNAYNWLGFDATVPPGADGWIPEDQVAKFKALHQELEELHRKRLVQTDMTGADAAESGAGDEASTAAASNEM